MALTKQTLKTRLNKVSPTEKLIKLGDLLDDLITQHNALLAKLDLDAGVTDTNYAATLSVKALDKRQ